MQQLPRHWFFSADDNTRLKDGDTPDQQTFERLLASVAFKTDDADRLLPTGGTIGGLLVISGKTFSGQNNYAYFDLDALVRDGDRHLLPTPSATDSTGRIASLVRHPDGGFSVVWKTLPTFDTTPFITISGATTQFVSKTSLYAIPGQSGNVVATIDSVTGRLPAALVGIPSPVRYRGVWDAAANTPALSNTHFDGFTLFTGPYLGTVRQPAGDFFRVSQSGTTLGATFLKGDIVIAADNGWERGVTEDGVDDVNGGKGNVNVWFLREQSGQGTDLTKAAIEAHIANDLRHLTLSAQTITGPKTFTDKIITDGFTERQAGLGITFDSPISFSGDPSVRIIGLTTGTTLVEVFANGVSGNTVPFTSAVKGYVDTKRNWAVPHLLTGSTLEATLQVTNDFTFTGTTQLNECRMEVHSVNNSTFAYFDSNMGYTADDIARLNLHVRHTGILGSGDTRPVIIDRVRTNPANIPAQLEGRTLFFGDDVFTSGSTYLSVELLSLDPLTGTYLPIPFLAQGGQMVVESNFDNISMRAATDAYMGRDLTVKRDLRAIRSIHTPIVHAGEVRAQIITGGVRIRPQANLATQPTLADVLPAGVVNRTEGTQLPGFVKLPPIPGTAEGTQVRIANTGTHPVLVTANQVPQDVILSRSAAPSATFSVPAYALATFTLIDKAGFKWLATL